MFKNVPIERQLIAEKNKNARLEAENKKLKSDVDYLAMMCDVELDEEVEVEKEVVDNG